jgi:hypothetical protein
MTRRGESKRNPVMLSGAKHLEAHADRPFAHLLQINRLKGLPSGPKRERILQTARKPRKKELSYGS